MDRFRWRSLRLIPRLDWISMSLAAYVLAVVVWLNLRSLGSNADVIAASAILVAPILVARQVLVAREHTRSVARDLAHEEHDRLGRLLEYGTDVIVLVDTMGAIRYATPSAQRVLGIPPDQLVGLQAEDVAGRDLVHDRLDLAMARPLDAAGDPLEVPYRLPDGTAKTLELVATRTQDKQGAPMLVVNVRDVTDRYMATQALLSSEAHNGALLGAIPDQILRFDRAGRFLGAAGKADTGSPFNDAALGKTLDQVIPPALARFCYDALELAFAEGGTHEISYSNVRPDGLHFFETRLVAVAPEEGLAIIRDVTDSHEAMADLRRLAQILDATPDLVCSFSMDGRITYANAAFRQLIVMPDDGQAVLVDSILSRFPDVRRTLFDVAIPEAVKSGFWRGDVEFVASDIEAPISMIVVAHRGPGEHADHLTFIGRDIRERRDTERALTEAKEVADAASRAKGEFLATMSHEIRTPMNGIIGAVELLLDTELSAEQRDFALTLRDSSEALLDIINDVLDFSKIEANSLELERIRFELRPTIDSVCGVLGSAAAQKGLQLLVSIDEGVPAFLEGDPARLRQVLTNLVGNAVKFTERGEVVVQVMKGGRAHGGRVKLNFEVRDTGIGISSEVQARLFQSFAQADGSMSRRFGGTGLGLAISRRLVGLMGGELGVHSRLGDGSTFWFTAEFECDPASRNAVPGKPLGAFRILVVDDKPTSRGILLEQLAGWGMRAFAESSEADARKAMHRARDREDPFVCVIVDDPVAGLSGDEMAARLTSSADIADAGVIVLGGSVGECSEMPRRAVHVAKPVRASDLLDCLVHLLIPPELLAAQEPAPRPTIGSALRPDARILLVEDNEVNRKIANAILHRLGYTPDVAADGFDALHAAEATRYDVILMDCQMPGMDGFEATARIRALEALQAGGAGERHVPIVALTANATEADRDRCLAAGMDDYLAKPVRSAAMRETVAKWLAAPQSGAEPAARAEPVAGVAAEAGAGVAAEGGTVRSAGGTPLLNAEAMADIRSLSLDDGEDMLASLVDLFFDQADKQLTSIDAAIQAGDAAALKSIAHSLKGSSRNVGAAFVGDLAAEIERRGEAGSVDAGLAAQLRATLAATRLAFLAERAEYEQHVSELRGIAPDPGSDVRGEAA